MSNIKFTRCTKGHPFLYVCWLCSANKTPMTEQQTIHSSQLNKCLVSIDQRRLELFIIYNNGGLQYELDFDLFVSQDTVTNDLYKLADILINYEYARNIFQWSTE